MFRKSPCKWQVAILLVLTVAVFAQELLRIIQFACRDYDAAHALAAPILIVEERTIGPSLGKENIRTGFLSVMYGMLAVLIFMIFYYRIFGIIADIALVLNLVLMVAVLSRATKSASMGQMCMEDQCLVVSYGATQVAQRYWWRVCR